jgi:hypothetical protein
MARVTPALRPCSWRSCRRAAIFVEMLQAYGVPLQTEHYLWCRRCRAAPMSWCSEASARRSVGRQREADRVGGEPDLRDGAAYCLPVPAEVGSRREHIREVRAVRRRGAGTACAASSLVVLVMPWIARRPLELQGVDSTSQHRRSS